PRLHSFPTRRSSDLCGEFESRNRAAMAPAVQLRGEHGVAKSEESTTRNKKRPPSHASASELKESAGLESRDATGEEMEPPTDFRSEEHTSELQSREN